MKHILAVLIAVFAIMLVVGVVRKLIGLALALVIIVGIAAVAYRVFIRKR